MGRSDYRFWGVLLVFGMWGARSTGYLTPPPMINEKSIEPVLCPDGFFRCADDDDCIPSRWQCDGHSDCKDGSDEPPTCAINPPCRPEEFRCALTNKCLPMGWVCDTEQDCGTSPKLGQDTSDESPKQCHRDVKCPWNEATCGDGLTCIHLNKFCDGKGDCADNGDEWDFCRLADVAAACDRLNCSFHCKPTREGPRCYCAEGQRPDGSKCVDADECELDGTCDQECTNTEGSFTCACVSGYVKNGTSCRALNVPPSEAPSLVFSTQDQIQRVQLDGKPWAGSSSARFLNSNALEFDFSNKSICYVHHNMTKAAIVCANSSDLNVKWELKSNSTLLSMVSVQQIALDWVSRNWYFLDDQRDILLLCSSNLRWCNILIETDLSKPRSIALDPTRGFMFFSKWGHSPPMIERCKLDGSERKAVVDHKIVYPYGVSIDFPTEKIYWIDTYLDFVERVDYNGKNRRTILRGSEVQNLYGVSVFENKLYLSSWHTNDIQELNKFTMKGKIIVQNISRPFNVHVYHRQRQPIVAHPCTSKPECDHLCVPLWTGEIAAKKCMCATGYRLNSKNKCVIKPAAAFLLIAKSKPASIKAIEPVAGNETMIPITGLKLPSAIDYDIKTNTVIYADSQSGVIESVQLNDTSKRVTLQKYIRRCDALAVDWMSRNLYWTDQEIGSISVMRLSKPSQSSTLILDPSFNPMSIALDPRRGIMYWADWSAINSTKGHIRVVDMNGKNFKDFVKNEIYWPSGLTLEFTENRLYWSDRHTRGVYSVDFMGANRRREFSTGEDPHGLTIGPDHTFYYTEFTKGTVMAYNKASGHKQLDRASPPILDLKLFDPKSQRGGENGCRNLSCPELCLPTPSGPVCACSDGRQLLNNTCVKRSNSQVPSRCPAEQFQCRNFYCVHHSFVCDGVDHCGDNSDEDGGVDGPCNNLTCATSQVKCEDNSRCIPRHWLCDGSNDCKDGSDEKPDRCTNACTAEQFRCSFSNRCIPMLWKCDGVPDCGPGDFSDENCPSTPCQPVTEFSCKNGRCISIHLFCDGNDDCKDGSDEVNCTRCKIDQSFCVSSNACLPKSKICDRKVDCRDGSDEFGCPKGNSTCESGEFTCTQIHECIPKKFVCDVRKDCVDGTDEGHCDQDKIRNATSTTLPLPPPKCDYPSRLCDNNTRCISVEKLCDGTNDCTDNSDEGQRCSELLCDSISKCTHHCHNAPEGLVCYCPPHLHLQPNRTNCLPTPPCEAWGVCSQKCVSIGSRYKCTCLEGYKLEQDGFTCKSVDLATPYVIYSNRHELRGVDLHNFNIKSFISSLKNTIALDFYHTPTADMVFWTDVIDDKIYRGTVVGGSLSGIEVVVQSGLSTAEGLAVDWIGENLYWVESSLDQIEVAKLNGSYRRTLVAGEMDSPRAVAVDPRDGWLFWTDWDNSLPRIERCSLAGLSRSVVVFVDQNGGWPNGLTLDYDVRRIYWIDARSDSIHTTKYDGTDMHEVIKNHEWLSHPFAITLFENYVYWTDWRTNSVVRANKWTGGDVSIIQRTLTQPFDIQVLHPSRQPRDGPGLCEKNNGGCSHLCLLHTNHTFRCDCPHVMRLSADGKTCVVNEKVLLIARAHEIRGVDIMLPYYHTIPTISLSQVVSPIQLEYFAERSILYWADSQNSEIRRSGLTSGPIETLVDTGLQNPTGLAIDWLSKLLFISSSRGITVSNLNAEFTTFLLEDLNALSIVAYPPEGRLFWIASVNTSEVLETSFMDGSNRSVIVPNLNRNSNSLCVDINARRLYWVSEYGIFHSSFDGSEVSKLTLTSKESVIAATVYENSIFYANDDDDSIHSADKITGANDTILRNNTGSVLALRVYDPMDQKGVHSCSNAKCQHLCLPNLDRFVCKCATGYSTDPKDPMKCVGVDDFILYSINWEVRGLALNGDNKTRVLGPISRISMATSIDFLASKDTLFWADGDRGSVTSITRAGTERRFIIEPTDAMDTPMDWLTGLAVDWIAENVYWCDSKRGTIQVARTDGTKQHVLLAKDIGKPTAIVVDPVRGALVWGGTRLEIASLDGRNRKLLVNSSVGISDIALDSSRRKIYFSGSGGNTNTIEVVDYDGEHHEVLLNSSLEHPVALTVLDDDLYWLDTENGGTINFAPLSNISNFKVLLTDVGESLKDIQIFSKRKQTGTNACAVNNGGCEQLCLFNGSHAVCVCSHGKIAADNRTCEALQSFIMYSRVVSIDSLQMSDDNILNAPHPSIKNTTILKNAIGLAFSYEHHRLFYSDIQKGTINTVYYNGSDHRVVVKGQGSVEGLAYEKVYNSLYWTCNNHATINRVNLTDRMTNASKVEQIVRLRSLDKPRGIAIDSCGSRVFWTNWNSHHPSIESAFLSGYGRAVIVQTDIRMPNALALDHRAQKLYWGDARLDKIERCEYDGSNRVILSKLKLEHPFAMAVYGDFIYWTDWMLQAVLRADKLTGQNVMWLRRDVARPMGIIAIANDSDDCSSNPCSVVNGGCEEICSLTAAATLQCSCIDGHTLAEDGKRCYTKLKSCDAEVVFRCSDGSCVPFTVTCDGIPHCTDKSDEEPGYCGHRTCPVGWFQCNNKRCIQSADKCNRVDDCGDSSDELECSCSEEDHFKCANGECILKQFRCDSDPDCKDYSDEMGCESRNCSRDVHDANLSNCPNTTACIHKDWFCDGENDCWDFSDEKNCTDIKTRCDFGEFKCRNGTCISLDARCDSHDDCHDSQGPNGVSSDEENCKVLGGHCQANQFTCEDGTCIPLSWRCNLIADCQDNSDELGCIQQTCRSEHFKCANGECIPEPWQCDGQPDCSDRSDETVHCKLRACDANDFRCNATGRCIPRLWLCDGEDDCADGADEHPTRGCGVCTPDQFQCTSRACVLKIFYCDGDDDCADGSDEPVACRRPCAVSEFACKNGRCVMDMHKCDGKDDCGDHSDEEECEDGGAGGGHEENCEGPGWFRCANGVCINETLLCDGENNCGDYSDENKCRINECSAQPPPCSQTCIDKPVGYECQCFEGYQVSHKDPHLCEDIDECLQRPCSQICRNTRGSYHCSCASGYTLYLDKTSCRANSSIPVSIILANRYYIRELDLSGHSTLLAHNLTNAVALDYDWQSKCIYWSDVTQLGSSIKRLCDYKTNSSTVQILHSPTLQNPDGLAVDWIGGNLYWCDKGLDTIEVSSLDGRFRRILLSQGLEEPRAIALDPVSSHVYWTDWGSHVHIGKAGMDGSEPRVIVNSSLGWPNALTVSYDTRELFWADAREDYIAVSDLDGKNVHVVTSRDKNPHIQLHHVFAIDVWEDYIYWTDWETKTIERCHKYRGDQCKSLLSTVHRPMDIRVVHPFKQPQVDNPCKNANCSALCLLTPKAPHYTCTCPENFVLGPDGKSCIANCTSAHFECKQAYKCIPFWWKCDTQDDCGDGSDEPAHCRAFNCLPGQYQCTNGQCIHPSSLCNGRNDCGDDSDEKDCDHYTCLNTQFRCAGNGTIGPRCVPSVQRCNKHVDCPLGEDEADCPPATCPANQFKCANDKCIPAVWVCDTDNDCGDDSDEDQECHSRTCSPEYFRCTSGRCIPTSWRCDGDPDCPQGEDEPPSCSQPEYHTCEPTYFKCTNNKCIPGRWRCDYENDCGDGSDETGCTPRNCSESEFRCAGDGRCIRGALRCDGEHQCDDRSDEADCQAHQCKKNEYQCVASPHICIFLEWKCDGEADCADGSDEANCSDACPDNGFRCQNGFCINEDWRCDGQDDCDDASDEEYCSLVGCLPGRFRCKNDKCVPMSMLCDGRKQCEDGSDEDPTYCRMLGRCSSDQFTCKNSLCVASSLKCDGENDCGDNSDEIGCDNSTCPWKKCSQLCVEERKNVSTCKCVDGYSHLQGGLCQAKGEVASLVVASEAELRLISPYKPGDSNILRSKTLATAPGYKVDSIDVLYQKKNSVAFWTDHQNKRIQSMILHLDTRDATNGRWRRDVDGVQTILTGLEDPRGVAVDWVARRLYVTDGTRIIVSAIDGKLNYTLLRGDMQQPRDLKVSPGDGLVFWIDWGPRPRIEFAHMDGNKRKVLVDDNLVYPTGLTLDYTTRRLYWCDPKTIAVESVNFDGSDHRLIRHFDIHKKPFKIEVFEDTLYIATYHSHDILKVNKYGKGNVTALVQGVTRIADLLILQPEKQNPRLNNTCADFCHSTEFCLLTPQGATCTCADGYLKDNLTCKAIVATPHSCPLECNMGTCKMTQGKAPKCSCPPQYTGPLCEINRCSQHCKNKGMCYVDLASPTASNSQPPLRCNCGPEWTGDHCETHVNLCDGHCFNGGSCHIRKVGTPRPVCTCKSGFNGTRCQFSKQFCGKNGTPVGTAAGIKCNCAPGYTGDSCERNSCDGHCQNGGTCRPGAKQPECECPDLFAGRRCEIDLCEKTNPPHGCEHGCSCRNNGTCVVLSGRPLCKCPQAWGGTNCQIYVGNFNMCSSKNCNNGGICQITEDGGSMPVCRCPDGWVGDLCELPAICANHCSNGGTCAVSDGIPYCECPPTFKGSTCQVSKEVAEETPSQSKTSSRSVLIPVISSVLVIIGILVAFLVFDYFYRKRQTFSHERLQENDFNNPMYQDRDAEPFTLDADKSVNFANPVYESVYNGTTSGKEEKVVLLQHTTDETPAPPPEEA